jgi:hypothetical protein
MSDRVLIFGFTDFPFRYIRVAMAFRARAFSWAVAWDLYALRFRVSPLPKVANITVFHDRFAFWYRLRRSSATIVRLPPETR